MNGFWPVVVAVLLFLTLSLKPGPVPIDPPPKPDAVVPVPAPVDPTITGKRVILVYQTEGKMTRGQSNVLHSAKLSQWLDEHCEGGKAGWRRWDMDVDTKGEPELWQALWRDTKPKIKGLPALVVVDGQNGPATPLPDTLDEAIRLLEGR